MWNELCYHYNKGVNSVRLFCKTWDAMKPYIDKERHKQVAKKLDIQVHDAIWWKRCLLTLLPDIFKNELSKRHGKAFIQTERIEEG